METKELNFSNLDEFNRIIMDRYHKLQDVHEYLNEEGIGELEALKAIYYYSCFADDLKDLFLMEEFQSLTRVEGKPSSYYRTLNRAKIALKKVAI